MESDLTQSALTQSDLAQSDLTQSEFIESDLTQSELIESDLTQSALTQSDLIESDLIQSDLIKSDPTCNIFANAPSLGGAVVSSCAAFCVSLLHRMHYWMIYVRHSHTLSVGSSRTL